MEFREFQDYMKNNPKIAELIYEVQKEIMITFHSKFGKISDDHIQYYMTVCSAGLICSNIMKTFGIKNTKSFFSELSSCAEILNDTPEENLKAVKDL